MDLTLVPQSPKSGRSHTDGYSPRTAAADLVADLATVDDPLDAETVGSMFVANIELLGEDFEGAMIEQLLPAFEAIADSSAAGILALLNLLGGPRLACVAGAGLERLRAQGVIAPAWVDELSAPATAHDCVALDDPDGDTVFLAARFDRSTSAHSVLIMLDPEDCGEAKDVMLMAADGLPEVLAELRRAARGEGLRLTETALDPAEFRWRAEVAMDVRADHDHDQADEIGLDDMIGEDGPGYRILIPLLRRWLRALPLSDKPMPAHGNPPDVLAVIRQLATMSGTFGGGAAAGRRAWEPKPPKLPPKRKTRDGVAPILRLRIDLRGAKPPIWRRLDVPGDIPLATLHQVLQRAFDWHDAHLYVFETDYGTFGQPDPELGHRSDKSVTLEQVAASPGDSLTYTYDFGDDWEHSIAVEKSLPPEASVDYPRCVGGRRAAPPEDCGGIWGYQELLDILADPENEEHEDRLEWLGLDRAEDFDPAAFDQRKVTESLGHLRQKSRKRR